MVARPKYRNEIKLCQLVPAFIHVWIVAILYVYICIYVYSFKLVQWSLYRVELNVPNGQPEVKEPVNHLPLNFISCCRI